MQKWEHTILTSNNDKIFMRDGQRPKTGLSDWDALNYLGAEGWELVSTSITPNGYVFYALKRPKS
jgi:hypothetical protein